MIDMDLRFRQMSVTGDNITWVTLEKLVTAPDPASFSYTDAFWVSVWEGQIAFTPTDAPSAGSG